MPIVILFLILSISHELFLNNAEKTMNAQKENLFYNSTYGLSDYTTELPGWPGTKSGFIVILLSLAPFFFFATMASVFSLPCRNRLGGIVMIVKRQKLSHTLHKTIYIIEDDIASATMIREALELEGDASWLIKVLTDGTSAIEALNDQTPDLVLLDLRLPGQNGGEIFRYLRGKPDTIKMPILFITGATNRDLHDNGIDDGVLLRKPVNLSTLLHVVRTHLCVA
jgi:CheY-like chemotaxis protein